LPKKANAELALLAVQRWAAFSVLVCRSPLGRRAALQIGPRNGCCQLKPESNKQRSAK
jgi:hypothetical protein